MSGAAEKQRGNPSVADRRTDKASTGLGRTLEELAIRPIRPDDKARLQEFFGSLSPSTVALRFLGAKKVLSPAELAFFTEVDFAHHVALVATVTEGDNQRIIGTARFVILRDDYGASDRAEYAITLADEFQGMGVGRLLFLHLTQMAWARGVRTVELLISAGNTKMLNMVKHFGHVISKIEEAGAFHVRCSLDDPGESLWEH